MKQSYQVSPPQADHIKGGPLKAGSLAVAALTGLLIVPLSAHAQSSLNLYGLIDTGVSWVSTGTDRSGILSTGVASTSRLGFRGAEDLGNGLRAVFDLESGFNSDTGGQRGGPADRLFDRIATVGLAGDFGQIRLGRDTTPTYNAAGLNDLLGHGYWGNTQGFGYTTVRIDNAIFYRSPVVQGFSGEAAGSFGGASSTGTSTSVAGGSQVTESLTAADRLGRYYGGRLAYEMGPVKANAAYGQVDITPGVRVREVVAGASYDFGMIKAGVGYYRAHPSGADRLRGVNVGASMKVGTGTLLAQFYQIKFDSATNAPRANTFGLAYSYPVSRRTSLYASVGALHNNGAAAFSLRSASEVLIPSSIGENPRALSLGLRHVF
jgi:predicted porin